MSPSTRHAGLAGMVGWVDGQDAAKFGDQATRGAWNDAPSPLVDGSRTSTTPRVTAELVRRGTKTDEEEEAKTQGTTVEREGRQRGKERISGTKVVLGWISRRSGQKVLAFDY